MPSLQPSPSLPFNLSTIFVMDNQGIGANMSPTAIASAAYPAANRALFFPFVLNRPATIYAGISVNGSSVGGSVDMGVYTPDGIALVTSGPTVCSGTFVAQQYAFNPITLDMGLYYMAIAASSTSVVFARRSVSLNVLKQAGSAQAASSYPLPADVSATWGAVASSYIPMMGLRLYDV